MLVVLNEALLASSKYYWGWPKSVACQAELPNAKMASPHLIAP
jgi:hypothetical protein